MEFSVDSIIILPFNNTLIYLFFAGVYQPILIRNVGSTLQLICIASPGLPAPSLDTFCIGRVVEPLSCIASGSGLVG